MKSSPLAQANKAGIKHPLTWSIGDKSSKSNLALDLTELFTIFRAPLTKNYGIFVYILANSFTNIFMFEKGESRTIPAMLGSLSP